MMSIPRPIKADMDTWSAQGNPDWSWEKILPVLKRIEADQDFPHSPIHGDHGPIYVKRKHVFDAQLSAPEQALLKAVTLLGLPRFDDQNEPNPYGIAPTARNIKDGKRQSSAVAYLGPARARRNLTIIGDAQVTSLILRGRNRRRRSLSNCWQRAHGHCGQSRTQRRRVSLAADSHALGHRSAR